MDAGKSKAYHYAADWLWRAKKAYQLMGKEAEWAAYLNALMVKHARKYRLIPLLEELKHAQ